MRQIEIEPVQKVRELQAGAAYLLPVGQYPLSPAEAGWVKSFRRLLIERLRAESPSLRMEVVIRQNGLYPGLVDRFVDHASSWMPEQGVAVMPHRDPPHVPTRDEMENIDPRTLGDDRRPLIIEAIPELVFRIGDLAGRDEAAETMGGHSALHLFLTRLDESSLIETWKRIFGARVTDRIFRALPLFVPLFGVRSFENLTAEEMEIWLTSFDLYLGESIEDCGILIASRGDLDRVIHELLNELPPAVVEHEVEILRW
jgi:hypothetical protein